MYDKCGIVYLLVMLIKDKIVKTNINHLIYGLFIVAFFFSSCENDEITKPSNSSGPITFMLSPVDTSKISQATPLGNLNPPGHTFPTDHIYFYLNDPNLVEVRAMATGTVRSIYHNTWSNDYRVEFKHTETFYSYFDHIKNLPVGVVQGATVQAGDLIGYGDRSVSAVDLGVVDYDSIRGFIVPARYHDFSLHCGDPYKYFSEEVRGAILKKNLRAIEPRGGKIDFDRDSTLSGNWFLEGTPVNGATGIDYAANHLAFVYDMFDPSKIRIAAGGTLNLSPFNYCVNGNAPNPRNVTMASGLVKYEFTKIPTAVLLVQMMNVRKIKVEVFPNKTKAQVSNFTASAQLYVR